MPFWLLFILGIIAGGTIFIGLPFGRLRNLSSVVRASLSMFSAGIIAYLLIEILGDAAGETSGALNAYKAGSGPGDAAALLAILLIVGFFIGLVGLAAVQQRVLQRAQGETPGRLSLMIAIGIGLHNLSEGLAIGQAAAQGLIALSIGLVIGFGLHNATEGFGIIGPLLRDGQRPTWRALLMLGLIGGGPTLVGTLLGSLWTSTPLSVFVLAMAGGALLYVLKELFGSVRKETRQALIMSMLVAGFTIGWGSSYIADSSLSAKSSTTEQTTSVDGDASGSGTQTSSSGSGAGVSQTTGMSGMQGMSGMGTSAQSNQAVGVMTDAQMKQQDQMAADEMHEKAMVPTILPDGTKQFVLTASTFRWHLYIGQTVQAWGYNGQVPGPLIRVKVGDKVAIVVHNHLPEATTVHWHGLAVPNSMDGVPGVTQDPIAPGGSFTYRFTVTPQMIGTHYYHSHYDDDYQVDSGLHGLLIVDPAHPTGPHYNVDAIFDLGAWKVMGSETENVFTMDGKPFPEAPQLNVKRGQRVLIRLVNSSAECAHAMHLHGYTFDVVAIDGNPVAHPQAQNTVTLLPGETADIAFVANNAGKWMFHCHILDHTINPGDEVDMMGGLMTYINVS